MAPKAKVKEQAKPVASFYSSVVATSSRAAMLLPLWDDEQIAQENWGMVLGLPGAGATGGGFSGGMGGGVSASSGLNGVGGTSGSGKSGEGKQAKSKDGGGVGAGNNGAVGGAFGNCFVDVESRTALDKFILTFYEESIKKDAQKKTTKKEEKKVEAGSDISPAAVERSGEDAERNGLVDTTAAIPPLPPPPLPKSTSAEKNLNGSKTKKGKATAAGVTIAGNEGKPKGGGLKPDEGTTVSEEVMTGKASATLQPVMVTWQRPADVSKPFRPIVHRNSTPFLFPYAPKEALLPIDAKEELAKANLMKLQQEQQLQAQLSPPRGGETSGGTKKSISSASEKGEKKGTHANSGHASGGTMSRSATPSGSVGAGGISDQQHIIFETYPETVSIIEEFVGADAAARWKGMSSDVVMQSYREMSPLMEPYDPTLLFSCAETPAEACGSRYSTALRHKLQQAETLEALPRLPPFLMSAFNSVLLVLERAQQLLPPGEYLWERIYPHAPGTCHPVYNPFGKYAVKLFVEGAFRMVIVDDALPVDELGRPLITVTLTRELWPALLVKAVFKAFGLDAGRLFTDDPELLLPCFLGNYIPQYICPKEDMLGTTAELLRYQMQLDRIATGKLTPKNVVALTCPWNVPSAGYDSKNATQAGSGGGGGSSSAAHGNTVGSNSTSGGTSSPFAGSASRKGRGGGGKKTAAIAKKDASAMHGLEKLTAEEREPPNDEESIDKKPYLLCGLRTFRKRWQGKPSATPPEDYVHRFSDGPYSEIRTAPKESHAMATDAGHVEGAYPTLPPPPTPPPSSSSSSSGVAPPPGYGTGVQLFAIVDVVAFRQTLALRVETMPRSDLQAGIFHREQESKDVQSVLHRDDPILSTFAPGLSMASSSSLAPSLGTVGVEGGRCRSAESRNELLSERLSHGSSSMVLRRPLKPNWHMTSVWLTMEEFAEEFDSLVVWRCFDHRYLRQVSIEYDVSPIAVSGGSGGVGHGGGSGGAGAGTAGAGFLLPSGAVEPSAPRAPKKYTVQWCTFYSDRPEEVCLVAYAPLPPPPLVRGENGEVPEAQEAAHRPLKKTLTKKVPTKKGSAGGNATVATTSATTKVGGGTTSGVGVGTKDADALARSTATAPGEEVYFDSVASTGCPTQWVQYDLLRKEPKGIQLVYYQHHLPEPLTQSMTGVYEYGKLRVAAVFSLKPGAHIFRLTIPEMEFGEKLTLTSDAKMTLCNDLSEALKSTFVYSLTDAGTFPSIDTPERETIWFKRITRVSVPTRLTIVLQTLLPSENPVLHRHNYLAGTAAPNARGGGGGGGVGGGGKPGVGTTTSSGTNGLQGEGGGGGGGGGSGRGKSVLAGALGTTVSSGGSGWTPSGTPGVNPLHSMPAGSSATTENTATVEALLRPVERVPIMRFTTMLVINLDTREEMHISRSGGGGGHLSNILLEPNHFGYLVMAYASVPASEVAAVRAANDAAAVLGTGGVVSVPHSTGTHGTTNVHSPPPVLDRKAAPLPPRTEEIGTVSTLSGCVENGIESVGGEATGGLGGASAASASLSPLFPRGVWKLTIRSNHELGAFETLTHNAHVVDESHNLERGGNCVFFRQLCAVTEPVHISLVAEVAEHFHLPVIFRVLHLRQCHPSASADSGGIGSPLPNPHGRTNSISSPPSAFAKGDERKSGTTMTPTSGGGGGGGTGAPPSSGGNVVVTASTPTLASDSTEKGTTTEEKWFKVADSHGIESMIASMSGETLGVSGTNSSPSFSSGGTTAGESGGIWGTEVCCSEPQERHVFIPDLWLDATEKPKLSFYLMEGSIPSEGVRVWDRWCRLAQEKRFLTIRAAAENGAVERQQKEGALLKRDPAQFVSQKLEEQQQLFFQQQQNESDFRSPRDGSGFFGTSSHLVGSAANFSGGGGHGGSVNGSGALFGSPHSGSGSGASGAGGGNSPGAGAGGNRKGRGGDRRKGGGGGGGGGGGAGSSHHLGGGYNGMNTSGMSWSLREGGFPQSGVIRSGSTSCTNLLNEKNSFSLAEDGQGSPLLPGVHSFQATTARLLALDTVDPELLVPYHVELILSTPKADIRNALPQEDPLAVLRQHWKESALRLHGGVNDWWNGTGRSSASLATNSPTPGMMSGTMDTGSMNTASLLRSMASPSPGIGSGKVAGVGKASRLQQLQREQAAAEEQLRGEQGRQSRFRFLENPSNVFIPYIYTPGEEGAGGGIGGGGGTLGGSSPGTGSSGSGGAASGGGSGGTRGHVGGGTKGAVNHATISVVAEDTEERNFTCAPPIPAEEQEVVLLPIRAYEESAPITVETTSVAPSPSPGLPNAAAGREGRRGKQAGGANTGKMGGASAVTALPNANILHSPSANVVGNASFASAGNNSSFSLTANAMPTGSGATPGTIGGGVLGGNTGVTGGGNGLPPWEEEDTLQARGPLLEIAERLTDLCREKRDEQRKSRKEFKRRLYQYYALHPSLLNSEEGGGGGASSGYPSLIGNRDDDSVYVKRNKAPV